MRTLDPLLGKQFPLNGVAHIAGDRAKAVQLWCERKVGHRGGTDDAWTMVCPELLLHARSSGALRAIPTSASPHVPDVEDKPTPAVPALIDVVDTQIPYIRPLAPRALQFQLSRP